MAINFSSSFSSAVNSKRAVTDCVEHLPNTPPDILFFHATIGHDMPSLVAAFKDALPETRLYGCSCAGVVGVGEHTEAMQGLAVLAMDDPSGQVFAASRPKVDGLTSFETGRALGQELAPHSPRQLLLYSPGMDVAGDQLLRGLETELGEIPIFGGYASDNMQALQCFQVLDGEIAEQGVLAIAFCDPDMHMVSMATHGFPTVGEPGTVTRAEGNRIHEIDGISAWTWFTNQLQLPADTTFLETIPVGAIAEPLAPDAAKAYDNEMILRVISGRTEDGGGILYPVDCAVGTKLWLTRRDEEEIFEKMETTMKRLLAGFEGRKPVAVFHADCGARGRLAFGHVHKEELIDIMQRPVFGIAPCEWIGMYGLGEFAPLHGTNAFHNYTTALGILVR